MELDPHNRNYKLNFKMAELKLRASPMGGVRGFDTTSLLNNPSFLRVAPNLMNSSQVQQL